MMKNFLVAIFFGLFVASQHLCAQANTRTIDNEKRLLGEQIVLLLKKYEGLGLSQEELAQKVGADLLVQARLCQGDSTDAQETGNGLQKKLLIGGAIVGCGVLAYFVYVTFLRHDLLRDIDFSSCSDMDDGGRHYTGKGKKGVEKYNFYARVNKDGLFELDKSKPFMGNPDLIKAVLEKDNN